MTDTPPEAQGPEEAERAAKLEAVNKAIRRWNALGKTQRTDVPIGAEEFSGVVAAVLWLHQSLELQHKLTAQLNNLDFAGLKETAAKFRETQTKAYDAMSDMAIAFVKRQLPEDDD